MDYYTKYLKYKTKYLELKNQIGGRYQNLTFLGEGAESVVYKTSDNKALKIMKKAENFMSPTESAIITKIQELNLPNFPKYYLFGKCKSLVDPDKDTTEFCINDDEGKEYQYIIMDTIEGEDMMTLFYKTFSRYFISEQIDFQSDDYNNTKEYYIIFLLKVCLKIVQVLKDANEKFGFRHNDFDYRNCMIKEDGTPIIIDFGSSSMNDHAAFQCKDIRAFVNSVVKGSYCNAKAVYEKVFPSDIIQNKKDLFISNCQLISKDIENDNRITELWSKINGCLPYNDITFDDLEKMFNNALVKVTAS